MGQQGLKFKTEVDQPRKGIAFPQKHQGRWMESKVDKSEVEEEAVWLGTSCLSPLFRPSSGSHSSLGES